MPDVEGDHLARPALEQHLRESPGRRADVEGEAARPRRSGRHPGRASSLPADRLTHRSSPSRVSTASGATLSDAFSAVRPSIATRPSSIAMTARARERARPRRTSSASRRRRRMHRPRMPDQACGRRVTRLEHRAQLVVQLREGLGAGLERLILDDAEPRDERAGLRRRGCRRRGASSVRAGSVAHGLRI